MIAPIEVVTVRLAIDPSTQANGCMYVIPRTHNTGREGFSDYDDLPPGEAVFPDEVTASQRDTNRAVPEELEPNQCSLHDGRIIWRGPASELATTDNPYVRQFVEGRAEGPISHTA